MTEYSPLDLALACPWPRPAGQASQSLGTLLASQTRTQPAFPSTCAELRPKSLHTTCDGFPLPELLSGLQS